MSKRWGIGIVWALLLVGCHQQATPKGNLELVSAGRLKIGIEPGYQPFEMRTTAGELTGYDVEMARELGKRLGLAVDFVDTQWDAIIPGLQAGSYDMIISGMSITEERAQVVAFSRPYIEIGQTILLAARHTATIKSFRDLDRPEFVIVTQNGTTGDQAARANMPQAQLKRFEDSAGAAMEVVEGRADAFVFDNPLVAIYARRYREKVSALLEPFTREPVGIAMRKTSTRLQAAVDEALQAMAQDGTLQRLQQKYFVEMSWMAEVPQ